jgi:hypothetical protein
MVEGNDKFLWGVALGASASASDFSPSMLPAFSRERKRFIGVINAEHRGQGGPLGVDQ